MFQSGPFWLCAVVESTLVKGCISSLRRVCQWSAECGELLQFGFDLVEPVAMLAASSLAAYCPEAAFMLATQDHASSHCGR